MLTRKAGALPVAWLGIILLEPKSFFKPCFNSQPSNQHVFMHDTTYRHIKINKGETNECPSFPST
jgi:hypothetical protein